MQVRSRRRRVQPVVGEKESLGPLDTFLHSLSSECSTRAVKLLNLLAMRQQTSLPTPHHDTRSRPRAEHHIDLTCLNLHRLLHATSE